jgi:hypothetical protein
MFSPALSVTEFTDGYVWLHQPAACMERPPSSRRAVSDSVHLFGHRVTAGHIFPLKLANSNRPDGIGRKHFLHTKRGLLSIG